MSKPPSGRRRIFRRIRDPLRYHRRHDLLHGAYGRDRFGRIAEKAARFFGTPQYLVGQSLLVAIWIILNALALSLRWDPYPFHPAESRVFDAGCLRCAVDPAG